MHARDAALYDGKHLAYSALHAAKFCANRRDDGRVQPTPSQEQGREEDGEEKRRTAISLRYRVTYCTLDRVHPLPAAEPPLSARRTAANRAAASSSNEANGGAVARRAADRNPKRSERTARKSTRNHSAPASGFDFDAAGEATAAEVAEAGAFAVPPFTSAVAEADACAAADFESAAAGGALLASGTAAAVVAVAVAGAVGLASIRHLLMRYTATGEMVDDTSPTNSAFSLHTAMRTHTQTRAFVSRSRGGENRDGEGGRPPERGGPVRHRT
jgi:hypothetical protein